MEIHASDPPQYALTVGKVTRNQLVAAIAEFERLNVDSDAPPLLVATQVRWEKWLAFGDHLRHFPRVKFDVRLRQATPATTVAAIDAGTQVDISIVDLPSERT